MQILARLSALPVRLADAFARTPLTVAPAAVALVVSLLHAPTTAAAVRVTLGDLDTALVEAANGEGDALGQLVTSALRRRLASADLALTAGSLVFEDRLTNHQADSGCTQTLIRNLDTRIQLTRTTALELELESLDAPIRVSLDLVGNISAEGRARQRLGIRIGRCIRLATDNFDIQASGPFALRLDLQLQLRPDFVAPDRLRFQPTFTLDGQLLSRDIDVDVDDSLLRGLIESLLLEVIEDAFSGDRIEEALDGLRASVSSTLNDGLDDGALEVQLPAPDDTQVAALYDLLAPGAPLALTLGHLEDRRIELLAAALLGDEAALADLLGDAAMCEALGLLQVPLAPSSAWSIDSGVCVPLATEPSGPGLLYSDRTCNGSFDFTPTDTRAFCSTALDTLRFGNAAGLPDDVARPTWTLSPGTRLELGATPLGDARQPFTTRLRYRGVETTGGLCELEMRVHGAAPGATPGPDDAPRRSLLALHGGSWSARSTGALGLEASVLPFTEAGFVVFAPFYRLIGENEGSPACRGATLEQVEQDAAAALDWVQANAARFGASGRPVLFGQSAGGHLAAALAFDRPNDVERAVLLYAPVDFADFVLQARSGAYTNDSGRRIVERVLDQSLEDVDVERALIVRNSFPQRTLAARASGRRVPPMFLMHGEMDELLPSRQSVRLCNALAGDVENGPAPLQPALTAYRRIIACDEDSELHLIAEGDHALDLCVADGLCASGSPASAALVADSLSHMVDWASRTGSQAPAANDAVLAQARQTEAGPVNGDGAAADGPGGGRLSPLALALLLVLGLARCAHRLSSIRRGSPA